MEKNTPKQKNGVVLREFSSGGVVFKKAQDGILWLVLKSAPSPKYPQNVWRLPKGWIDDSEDGFPGPISRGEIKPAAKDLEDAAIREAGEEGGVSVRIISKIGTEKFFFNSKLRGGKVLKFVTFYLMEWTGDLPEGPGNETSEFKWLKFNDARRILTHRGEKEFLDKAKHLLDSGIQTGLV